MARSYRWRFTAVFLVLFLMLWLGVGVLSQLSLISAEGLQQFYQGLLAHQGELLVLRLLVYSVVLVGLYCRYRAYGLKVYGLRLVVGLALVELGLIFRVQQYVF